MKSQKEIVRERLLLNETRLFDSFIYEYPNFFDTHPRWVVEQKFQVYLQRILERSFGASSKVIVAVCIFAYWEESVLKST